MKHFFAAAALLAATFQGAWAQDPEALYLAGAMNGWNLPTSEYVLNPTGEAGVYSATLNVPANQLDFKLFSKNFINWDDSESYYGTYGSFDIFSNHPAEVVMGHNLGNNFTCSNWQGGAVTITANINTGRMTLTAATQPEGTLPVYVIGMMGGWDNNNNYYALRYDATDGLYHGSYNVEQGKAEFRFYTQLGDWDTGSLGAEEGESRTFDDASELTFNLVEGSQKNFNFTTWRGGQMDFTLDLASKKVTIKAQQNEPVTAETYYLIGTICGWNNQSTDFPLQKVSEFVHEGTFDIPAQDAYFRVFKELGTWEGACLGATPNDGVNVDVTFNDAGRYRSETVYGKGCWHFPDWKGGQMTVRVDEEYNTISIITDAGDQLYLVGTPNGWDIGGFDNVIALRPAESRAASAYKATVDLAAGDHTFRFYNKLGSWDEGSLGATADDGNNVSVSFDDKGAYSSPLVEGGKGAWVVSGWKGGKLGLTVDTANGNVALSNGSTTGIESVATEGLVILRAGDTLSFSATASYTIVNAAGGTVMSGNASTADLSSLPRGLYIVSAANASSRTTAKIIR